MSRGGPCGYAPYDARSRPPEPAPFGEERRVTAPKLKWWKLLSVWGVFVLLHFSYETFPGLLFRLLGEDHEATYFHMKMLFVAYVAVSLVELLAQRRQIGSVPRGVEGFVYSRALIAVAYPWLTITMWFTAEALGVSFESIGVELVYANVLTVLGIYLALRMEELFEGVIFRTSTKALVVLLFATAVLSYVAFSLDVPEHFFTTPPEYLAE